MLDRVFSTYVRDVILTPSQDMILKRGCPIQCQGEAGQCPLKGVQSKIGFPCTPRGLYDKEYEFMKREQADRVLSEEMEDIFGKKRYPNMKDWDLKRIVSKWQEIAKWARKFIGEGRATIAANEGTFIEQDQNIRSSLNQVTVNLHEQMLRETMRNIASQIPGITDVLDYVRRDFRPDPKDGRFKRIARNSSAPTSWATRSMIRDLLYTVYKYRDRKFFAVSHEPDDFDKIQAQNAATLKAQGTWKKRLKNDLKHLSKDFYSGSPTQATLEFYEEFIGELADKYYREPKPRHIWGTVHPYELLILCGIRSALDMGHEESIGDLFLTNKNGSSDLVTEAMSYLMTNKVRSRESEEDNPGYDGSEMDPRLITGGPFSIADPYWNKGRFYGPKMVRYDLNGNRTGPINSEGWVDPVPMDYSKWTEIGSHQEFCKKQRVRKVNGDWVPMDVQCLIGGEVKTCNLIRENWDQPVKLIVKEGDKSFVAQENVAFIDVVDINRGAVADLIRHYINVEDFKQSPTFRLTKNGKLMATFYVPVPWGFIKREHWPDKIEQVLFDEQGNKHTAYPYKSDGIAVKDYEKDGLTIDFQGWTLEVSVYGQKTWMEYYMDQYNVSYEEVYKDWLRGKCIFGLMKAHDWDYKEAETHVDQYGVNHCLEELKTAGQIIEIEEGEDESYQEMEMDWENATFTEDTDGAQGLPY
jgi:hypothetical protein